MNDLGEDSQPGTPSMCSKMRTYPSLFTSWPPSLPSTSTLFFWENPDVFVAPTVLVMEHFERTIAAHCQRVFVCWTKSLLPLPPLSNHFGLNLVEMSELHRAEGPHSSGPLCSRGPGRGLVSEVAACQVPRHFNQGLNTRGTPLSQSLTYEPIHCPTRIVILLSKPCCFYLVVRNLNQS